MKTFPLLGILRIVMKKLILRVLLIPSCVAALLAFSPSVQATPRMMDDDELDQVCAKGSDGYEVNAVAVHQMVFDLHQQTSVGRVNCTGVIVTEVLPGESGRTQVTLGSPRLAAGNTPSSTRHILITSPVVQSARSAAASAGVDIISTDIQIVNGTVRIRGDINVDVQALPGSLRALQQNQLVLPRGFNLPAALALGGR
jgi:hypothetical protein